MIIWELEKNELDRLINVEHVSYEAIGRRYGVSGSAVKKAAKKIGISLPQRRRINPKEVFRGQVTERPVATCLNCGKEFKVYASMTGKYCSNKCQQEHQYKEYIEKWKNHEIDGTTKHGFVVSKRIYRYMLERADYKCERCGWCETNEHHPTPPLQLHHIDGNCLNNKEENLIILCPNCHSLTDNYGSKNRNGLKERTDYFGKGRDGYYKRKAKLEARKKDLEIN